MMKKSTAFLGLLGFIVILGAAAQVVPTAVSPGNTKGMAVVGERCPTFSWTAVDWATGYRIAVYQALGVAPVSYEQIATGGAAPVLSKDIEGRGLSWTPSSEEALAGAGLYIWFVEAINASGQGVWSAGKVFMVDEGSWATGTDERVTRILRERGVRNEVITDVLKEMKGGMTGAIAGDVSAKPSDGVRPMGTEGETNTYYGLNAGEYNGGSQNSFFGRSAGYNSSGSWNTFVGATSGIYNTTGNSNTFVGGRAGYTNSTGIENTFIGRDAGFANSAGNYNVFLGALAGANNTTGNYNTFLGSYSGRLNTIGIYNSFVGDSAGYSNTIGCSNAFFGQLAGYGNTSGSANTFIGYKTGTANTTGANNTFIGDEAGLTNATGTSNSFLGRGAGMYNTIGSYNIFFGLEAGYSNTSGSSNTFLGTSAGYNNTGGSGNVFLGKSAGLDETGSNKLYISNSDTNTPLIYGEFDNGLLGVSGKFGVGTKTPTYPMELKTTGRNATFVIQRTEGGAINFVNATLSYGQFGTGNNYPVRIQVNNSWKVQLDTDNSLTMASGATCTAGGVWTNASSRELKKDIETLKSEEAESALAELSPVKYAYKADPAERHVGFIAEDVPEIIASKDRKTLSPMDIVAVLTKVVQEQQKTIAELKAQVAELRKTDKPNK